MYHIAVGDFGIAWEDTAGYIAGTPVVEALRRLPKTDIRLGSLAVAGRSVMDLHNSLLRPKVFIPLHLDSCMYLAKKGFDEHLAALPPENRPEVWFLTDPGSYLRPIVIDPEAEIWER
jgi:hypothetical protein